MCGITGSIWTSNSQRISQEQLERMTTSLSHRGPDDVGNYYLDDEATLDTPSVALGFRRLSIIDLQSGHQPITNEDETIWLVFNGEIYNYQPLRSELKADGHQFRTNSDSEVIVHLYEKYGTQMFQYLNGMFALAIWDDRNKQLVIGRDRLGQKPLYYSQQTDRLLFASELKSLIASGQINPEIEPRALDHYFIYQYIPHPLCIYKNVQKLAPGHYAVFKQGQLEIQKYWQPDFNEVTSRDPAAIQDRLAELLTDSVKLRLQSDVPLGAFLSGGIDSSIVVALMQQHASQRVKTFSIGFPIKQYDESAYARQVAKHLDTDHHELIIEPTAVEILPSLVQQYDEPFSDSSAIPTWYISEFT
ncbi:MAG: asparagine synthase (glutamine-hydrolyzing), partial [Planctomycetota bacterium]|nr:asparagine synthase (glutamine-hydrolyzing) [Planctomycetota bacterium]